MERHSVSCGRHVGRVVVVLLWVCVAGPSGGGWRWVAPLVGVSGEAVYHRRHHEDQMLLNPPRITFQVNNEDEALNYLVKYGYLKCLPRGRVKRDIPSEVDTYTDMTPHPHTTNSPFVTSQTDNVASTVISPLDGTTGSDISSFKPTTPDGGVSSSVASTPSSIVTSSVITPQQEARTDSATAAPSPGQRGPPESAHVTSPSIGRQSQHTAPPAAPSPNQRGPYKSAHVTSPSIGRPSQQSATPAFDTNDTSSVSPDLDGDILVLADVVMVTDNSTLSELADNTTLYDIDLSTSNETVSVTLVTSPQSENVSVSLMTSTQPENVSVSLVTSPEPEDNDTYSDTESDDNETSIVDVTSRITSEPLSNTSSSNQTTTTECPLRAAQSLVQGNETEDEDEGGSGGAASLSEGNERVEGELAICTLVEEAEALRHFQRIYLRQESGQVDLATLKSMNQRRCGNTDQELDEEATRPSTTSTPSVTPTTERIIPKSRRKRRALERIEKARELRRAEKMNAHTAPTSLKRSQALPDIVEHDPAKEHERTSGLLDRIMSAAGRAPPFSWQRRKQQLEELKVKLSQEPELPKYDPIPEERIRHKRSTPMMTTTTTLVRFDKAPGEAVTWRLMPEGFSRHIPVIDVRTELTLAFRMWSEVIPLTFEEKTVGNINDVDIEISFVVMRHLACPKIFDGAKGEIAHSWATGNIHFDDDEDFKSSPIAGEISLLAVAVHEIGHVLGLIHTTRPYSIMFAVYNRGPIEGSADSNELELGWEDRKDVQNLYGPCKGTFDTVFDWIRLGGNGQGLIFNTYFARDENYWMYENRYNRTRYGDPNTFGTGWPGVPSNVDSYAQAYFYIGQFPIYDAFFFKGEHYYAYDNGNNVVMEGYPRLIRDDFGPKNNSNDSIPENIDAVYFEPMIASLRFFKDRWVFQYPYYAPWSQEGPGVNQCCDSVQLFTDVFPTHPGEEKVLRGNIDTAYFVQSTKILYFFKGEDLWMRTIQNGRLGLKYMGKWFDRFYDICEP